MKSIILVLSFVLISCKSSNPPQQRGDDFDKIFYLKRSNDPKKLIPTLGEPEKIDTSNPDFIQYYFPKRQDQKPIKIFVNKKDNKISTIALTYWGDFDTYAYLKKRFKGYRWIERPIKSKAVDVVEELYKVEIPELGITFEYNNQDPLRRPMWIFFK